jgi:hypothetical protein
MTSGTVSESVGNKFLLGFLYFTDGEWFTIAIGVALISPRKMFDPVAPTLHMSVLKE